MHSHGCATVTAIHFQSFSKIFLNWNSVQIDNYISAWLLIATVLKLFSSYWCWFSFLIPSCVPLMPVTLGMTLLMMIYSFLRICEFGKSEDTLLQTFAYVFFQAEMLIDVIKSDIDKNQWETGLCAGVDFMKHFTSQNMRFEMKWKWSIEFEGQMR